PPVVGFTAAAESAFEGSGTVAVAVHLDTVSGQDVTVPFTVAGTASLPGDFTVGANPLIIPAGSLSRVITVTLVDDTLDEPDETVILGLGPPGNATLGAITTHTITIKDNEQLPSVSFTTAGQSAPESVGAMTVTALLSAVSSRDVIVPFTLS